MRPSASVVTVVVLAALSLGTSRMRPLQHKNLVGTATLPAGLATTAAPQAYFGENAGNKGCCSAQRLDVSARVTVRNTSDRSITLDPARVFVTIGSTRVGAIAKPAFILPRSDELIEVHATRAVPNAAFDAKRVEVIVGTSAGELAMTFDAAKAAVETDRSPPPSEPPDDAGVDAPR